MRFRFICRGVKNFIMLLLACVFTLASFVAVKAGRVCKLSALLGERTFYLDSVSSQALMKRDLSLTDVFRVRGESVAFATDEGGALAQRLIGEYGGKLLFTETVCGVASYYVYVPAWGGGVALYGQYVNLHIAIDEAAGRCAVGTPLIFGGF
ncbi:MAG: hypothetical protein IJW60_05360 [Clostridia bacterium]|nr:hypothetical protein [Clostridia bacterium]